ncbi:MAG: hypothetical protein MJZ53_05885 [Paludibacteraceae bacterium]|nr:hypothetical protein [Paludibacteraceae bacterium]
MDALTKLEANVHQLLERNQQLQDENAELKETIEHQRQEMMRTHSELVTIQTEHKNLRIAHGLINAPEQREIAKKQLAAMIAQVDKAIEVLKK